MTLQVLIILAVIFALILILRFFYRRDQENTIRKIEEVFGRRENLNDEDFYNKYFKAKGVPFFIAQKVRKILSEEFEVDLSRLSAEDDFSKNLSFFWEWDSASDVEIITKIEEEFQINLTHEELQEQFRTVDGIINLVWKKVREKELHQ